MSDLLDDMILANLGEDALRSTELHRKLPRWVQFGTMWQHLNAMVLDGRVSKSDVFYARAGSAARRPS